MGHTPPGGWPPFAQLQRVTVLSRCGGPPGVRASAAAAVRPRGKASGRLVVRRVPAGALRRFLSWLRIPIESDHLFRSNPIADSGVSDHLAGAGVS